MTLFVHSGLYENPRSQSHPVCEATTWFFRYPDLFERLARHCRMQPRDSMTAMLFAPSSIGCEPFSFAMEAMRQDVFRQQPRLKIHALDIAADLTGLARTGRYAPAFLARVPERYRPFIATDGCRDYFSIRDDVMRRVDFLPAQDLLEHRPAAPYDATVCLNLFRHIGLARYPMLGHLAEITRGVLCINESEHVDRKVLQGYVATSRLSLAWLDAGFRTQRRIDRNSLIRDFDQFNRPYTDADAGLYRVGP